MSNDGVPRNRQLVKSSNQFQYFGEHMENYNVETSALHRKLQSKMEALRILRRELEKFRTERDQFKLMAETLQLRYSAITRSSDFGSFTFDGNKSSVGKLLHDTREQNIKLTTEVERLKQKLSEIQADMELLRTKEYKLDKKSQHNELDNELSNSREELHWKEERANFISHLESLKKKNAQLAFDLKAFIDEKEEIITERDAYKCKAHRLNHELFVALKANESHPKFLDIDSIVLENKYLQERIKNYENELDLTKQSLNKYKSMLDSKRKKGIIKLGSSSNDESILSHKQVKTILENGIDLPTKTETIQDLKSLCLALLDNLNDKNLALSHQKKTNKMLATKIADLEQRIQLLTGVEATAACSTSYSPSQLLLNGYCPSLVDSNDKPTACNITDDSGTMSSEPDGSNKTSHSHAVSDDAMSSLSSESERSVISSEYGPAVGTYSLSDFTKTAMYAYKTPSTTTDSGNYRPNLRSCHEVPTSIVKQRVDDLKDLPPDLAEMVQRALHELDMRDFDEVIDSCEGVSEDMPEDRHTDATANDEIEDDDTIN